MEKPSGSLISYFSSLARQFNAINLAQGKPEFPPPRKLTDILRHKSRRSDLHQYAPGHGNPRLIDILTRHYSTFRSVESHHFLIVQGATEGIFLALFYLKSRLTGTFSVLSFDPVYESYPRLAEYLQLPFVYFRYGPSGNISFPDLRKSLVRNNVRIIMLASPGNPFGKIWNSREIRKLTDLCEELDIFLIFDAVYSDLYFTSPPANPLKTDSSKIIYINSFSKKLSITGWRVGYMIAPAAEMSGIRAVHDFTGLCAPSLQQEALAEYLEQEHFGREYAKKIRDICRKNRATLKTCLEKSGFPVEPADGGYFLWTRCPRPFTDGFAFACKLLQEAGVAVVPGENFSPAYHDHLRLNTAVSTENAGAAADRISVFCSGFTV